MKIITPCDWKTIDLLTTEDANDFGEALRNYCFRGNCETTGCYSTFDMMPFMKNVEKGSEIYEEAKQYLFEDIEPTIYYYEIKEEDCYMQGELNGEIVNMKVCEPCEIVCGWTWDGDGCLYFRFNDRKVSNTDCKKDYTWEWEE